MLLCVDINYCNRKWCRNYFAIKSFTFGVTDSQAKLFIYGSSPRTLDLDAVKKFEAIRERISHTISLQRGR